MFTLSDHLIMKSQKALEMKMNSAIDALNIYEDSIDIAQKLRALTEQTDFETQYWLMEAAIHIEAMYRDLVSITLQDLVDTASIHATPDGGVNFKPDWA